MQHAKLFASIVAYHMNVCRLTVTMTKSDSISKIAKCQCMFYAFNLHFQLFIESYWIEMYKMKLTQIDQMGFSWKLLQATNNNQIWVKLIWFSRTKIVFLLCLILLFVCLSEINKCYKFASIWWFLKSFSSVSIVLVFILRSFQSISLYLFSVAVCHRIE